MYVIKFFFLQNYQFFQEKLFQLLFFKSLMEWWAKTATFLLENFQRIHWKNINVILYFLNNIFKPCHAITCQPVMPLLWSLTMRHRLISLREVLQTQQNHNDSFWKVSRAAAHPRNNNSDLTHFLLWLLFQLMGGQSATKMQHLRLMGIVFALNL